MNDKTTSININGRFGLDLGRLQERMGMIRIISTQIVCENFEYFEALEILGF